MTLRHCATAGVVPESQMERAVALSGARATARVVFFPPPPRLPANVRGGARRYGPDRFP